MKTSAMRWGQMRKAQSAFVQALDLTISALERQQQQLEAERASFLESELTMHRFGAAVVDMQSRHVSRLTADIVDLVAKLTGICEARQLQARRLKLIETLERRSREWERIEFDQQQLADIIEAIQADARTSPGQA